MNAAPALCAAVLALAACSTTGTSRPDLDPLAGQWRATLDGKYHLDLDITRDQIRLTDGDIDNDIVVNPHRVVFDGASFTIVFDHSPFMPAHIEPPTPGHGDFTMTAEVTDNAMTGTGARADGRAFEWTAERIK